MELTCLLHYKEDMSILRGSCSLRPAQAAVPSRSPRSGVPAVGAAGLLLLSQPAFVERVLPTNCCGVEAEFGRDCVPVTI